MNIFKHIVDGLVEVHRNNILHRDLKPENIFINQNIAKLGDFGLAKKQGDPEDKYVAGTEAYIPPELKQNFLKGTKPENQEDIELAKKQDVYQIGLILYELMLKIRTNMQKIVLFRNLVSERRLSEQLTGEDPKLQELILRMTHPDPAQRPSALEI